MAKRHAINQLKTVVKRYEQTVSSTNLFVQKRIDLSSAATIDS